MSKLNIYKTRDVETPNRAHKTDSGIDFFVPKDLSSFDIKVTPLRDMLLQIQKDPNSDKLCFYIAPWDGALIPSWIKMVIEPWYDLVFDNKSWIAVKQWLVIWAKVIDSSYRWEVHLHLINTSNNTEKVVLWQKIAQWILRKVELDLPEEITDEDMNQESSTQRWAWWFWSTW